MAESTKGAWLKRALFELFIVCFPLIIFGMVVLADGSFPTMAGYIVVQLLTLMGYIVFKNKAVSR
ncbi:hypothetical protein DFP83_10164 [Idiomarina fontislapidosi]|uniref:Uncharacterized protein n=1 Tax=Idiomarina fontislapidosi TaxID=263723 RepID=A0A432YAR9_9GAMM|nr:hypothetical protein [Idiomarina fontislapidosi]PYE35190.1 hypothetical protein DFP83_10164 [Idiomarina fontislapidosi]RUO58085.1 hypothetical protein CWE25_00335 [Idiomarina fontislapidosi]|tara:strand:+ start:4229 stop:4423 length:195 start_codon:yes stop_codon:yes gene_type:complete